MIVKRKSNIKDDHFNVCLLEWPGPIPYFEAYREFAETVDFGLKRLGLDSKLSLNQIDQNRTNIIFGFHILSPEAINALPESTIIYNLEQIDLKQAQKPAMYNLKSKFTVWDYSHKNCRAMQKLGVTKVKRVPIGYVPEMTRIKPAKVLDIDVLFYGLISTRRHNILQALANRGLKVEAVSKLYGKERDNYISRAKIVLNMHLYETQIFEAIRVSYLLANSKAVVSECNDMTEFDEGFSGAVAMTPYHQLVDTCVELVHDTASRIRLESRGYEIMSARNESQYLREALKYHY